MKFSGKVWRHVPHGAHPLHLGFILRAAGRFNRGGRYGALYTSLTPEGALAELHKLMHWAAFRNIGPRELVSIDVRRVEPVLDLTSGDARDAIGITIEALTGDTGTDLETCRGLADWARAEGYQAILAPSAAAPDATNLVIYVDGPVKNLDFTDGPDRLPIPEPPG